ncbi:MAG: hypothetical protein WCK96_16985 [Methylococcales bacterium]
MCLTKEDRQQLLTDNAKLNTRSTICQKRLFSLPLKQTYSDLLDSGMLEQ